MLWRLNLFGLASAAVYGISLGIVVFFNRGSF